jgi:haloalkane dehalogenase
MDVYRTADARFDRLPAFPWEPHYVEVDGLRIAFIDEGEGPVVLLLHGEPSWSFLYRKMIPPLLEAGFRVLAPDLVGFGRSDKPTSPDDYSYQRHVDWTAAWLHQVGAGEITLFGQDWGGLIGLRLVAEEPDRFARVAAANTMLPTGDHRPTEAFLTWQRMTRNVPSLDIGRVIQGATVTELPPEVIAAYDAPFPEEASKAGARIFPSLVPTSPDDPASGANRRAWQVLEGWEKPFLCLFSDSDPVTAGGDGVFRKLVPGTAGQPHRTIADAGHFLQEDAGPLLGGLLAAWAGEGT